MLIQEAGHSGPGGRCGDGQAQGPDRSLRRQDSRGAAGRAAPPFPGRGTPALRGHPGYRATTVAALSEAAGLSTRQFYEEFRTLEDVLAALHLEVNDWATAAVLAAVADADHLPLAERAAAIFRAYAADVTSDPRRVRITFVEIIGVSARLEEQRLARRAHWVDLVCAEANRAVLRGRRRCGTIGSRRPGSSAV